MAGVGAAAHREGGLVLPCHFIVGVDKGLDGRAVRFDIEGDLDLNVLQRGGRAAGGFHRSGQRIAVGGSRIAAVIALAQAAILHLDGAADDGQRRKHLVRRRNAERAAIGGGVQGTQDLEVGSLFRGADTALEQAVDNQANGVDCAFRHGRMAALAPAADNGGAVLPFFKGHAGRRFERTSGQAHRAGRTVGHRIARHAALKVHNHAILESGADNLTAETALLTVADRELGVRCKAERGHGEMLLIILNIVHMGFLIGTQQRADGVFEGDAAVLEILQCIEAEDARAFVISHAAAQQPAVTHADRVGVSIPAVALRHHIGVGNGGQIFLTVRNGAGLRPADITIRIMGIQPQLGGNGQRSVQRIFGTAAKRCARFRCAFNARHGNQTGNVAQDVFTVLFRKGVNGRPTRIIHGVPLLFLNLTPL